MEYRTTRRRPTAYPSPGRRPICVSTGRGDTKVNVREAVALATELLAAVARVDPSAVTIPTLLLPLAERVAAQSEILQARACA